MRRATSLFLQILLILLSVHAVAVQADDNSPVFIDDRYYQELTTRYYAKPDPQKAIVYMSQSMSVYHGPSIMGMAMEASNFWVFANSKLLGIVPHNTYTYSVVEPGKYTLWATPLKEKVGVSALNINLEAGKTYFVTVRPVYTKRSPHIIVLEGKDAKKAMKSMKHFCKYKPAAIDKAREISGRKFDLATSQALEHPYSILGSRLSFRKKPIDLRKRMRRFGYIKVRPDKPRIEPSADKASIYILGPNHRNVFPSHPIWIFANNKLLTAITIDNYTHVQIDPGEYVFWSAPYQPRLKNISAIKMRVEAGKTYYMEVNQISVRNQKYPAPIPLIRIVNEKIGNRVIAKIRYYVTLGKGNKDHMDYVLSVFLKKFYKQAKAASTLYPATVYGGSYVPPEVLHE